MLDNNKWDSLELDQFFCGEKTKGNKINRLRNAGYLGYIMYQTSDAFFPY